MRRVYGVSRRKRSRLGFVSVPLPKRSTGEAAVAHHQRSDVCAVPAAGVVAEAMVALVLANAALEKFGGDSVSETRRNCENYLKQVADRGLQIRSQS